MRHLSGIALLLLLLVFTTGCSDELAPTAVPSTPDAEALSASKGHNQDVVFNETNGNYYQTVAQADIAWNDAYMAAAAMKYRGCIGHLATITSPEENDFIASTFPDAPLEGYWLGGAQDPLFGEPAGGWGWVTGEPFVYTNWFAATGEPNDLGGEDVLHFMPPFFVAPGTWVEGTWNDANAVSGFTGYVVEYDCPPNGPVMERVSGSGHFTVGDELRTFSFNARKFADGTVQGEWQLNNRAADAKEHGNVTCFAIEGNQVWLGGFAEQGSDGEVGWTVVDNGEGTGAPPDQISLKFIDRPLGFASAYCTATPEVGEPFGLALNDVEAGNIQIKQ